MGTCAMWGGNVQTDVHAQFQEMMLMRIELAHNLSVLQQLKASVAESSQAKNSVYTVLLPPLPIPLETHKPHDNTI